MKSISLALVVFVLVSCGQPDSQLAGTWNLVADQELDNDGNVIKEDRNVRGQLIYTPEGNMNVQILWVGTRESMMNEATVKRDGFPAGLGLGENTWTSEQRGLIIDTYDSYFGRYSVDWNESIVSHIVEGDLRPQLKVDTLKRKFTLKGDTLILRGLDLGLRWQVIWVRKR
jgi:hypothetical protein